MNPKTTGKLLKNTNDNTMMCWCDELLTTDNNPFREVVLGLGSSYDKPVEQQWSSRSHRRRIRIPTSMVGAWIIDEFKCPTTDPKRLPLLSYVERGMYYNK